MPQSKVQPLSGYLYVQDANEAAHVQELLAIASDPARASTVHLGQLMNAQLPNVRREVGAFLAAMDHTGAGPGRHMPFQERKTTHDAAALFGVDHDVASRVYQRAVDESLTAGLQARMGTDATSNLPPEPPSLRDHIAAAVDVHTDQE